MARNAQVWTHDYGLLLDGPRAGREEIARAEHAMTAGGRFGYRFYYPPMRAGAREVFWHTLDGRSGYVTAERAGHAPLELDVALAPHPDPRHEIELDALPPISPADAATFGATATRDFEERYWRTIADLAEGDLRDKNNADCVSANAGRSGGPVAATVHRAPAAEPHLELVGEYCHRRYAELLEKHGMAGRAVACDHVFRWETEFDYGWMGGWKRNREQPAERNVVLVIPGRDRGEAVIMGDHYDTAYMEDLYGADKVRCAAAGADDNHSATAALLLAADVLLPLAREGRLARDVWLVHLTGEEFPSDCLGARALARALVERSLVFTARDGRAMDVSRTRARGVFVLDMVAHDNDKHPGIFQIAPGEGRAAERLAWHARVANERWNAGAKLWNESPERRGRGRSKRMETGAAPPPLAEHRALRGEVRPEWSPKSAIYNTDGQIFSDVGVPVVLFMENYDISRKGYHDTHDTMKNIDLDYGAALTAIAIETVAQVAMEP
jgi:hypothetical protein